MGVFLDVDIYDKVPEGPLKYIDMFLCDRILTINKGVVEGNGLKNKLRNVFLKIVFPNRRKFLMFFQKVAEWLGQVPGRYTYRELFGAYHGYNKLPYEARIFENYTTIEFEGRRAMIVRDYIDYLQTRYNRTDFYEPKEKQVAPHYIYVNFNKPYKEFMREKNLSIPSMEDIK
jgi:phosphorylcholine metabolism protein LicD